MAKKDTQNTGRPLLHTKWAEVYQQMAVHTQNDSPELIFRQRRPIESRNEYALEYRIDNHRNTVKSAFDLAIEQYIEAAYNVDAIEVVGETTREYLKGYYLFDGYKETKLKEWLFSWVGSYKQTDPNAFVCVLPMHPTEELIPSYEADIPVMESAPNMPPRPAVWLIPSADIEFVSDYEFKFKAGSWIVDAEGNLETYYFHLTKDQITLIYPTKSADKKIEYREMPWYAAMYDTYSAFVIGSKKILFTDHHGDEHKYYVSDFVGAANVADKLVGNMSDLDIIETRFTHPLLWMRKKECDAQGCMPNLKTGYHERHGRICGKCNGSGFINDTSPMGVFQLDDKEDYADSGNPKLPAGFITPDTAILKHKADRTDYYYQWMMRELGLNISQNMTNASGESKRYDMMQKVTLISGIVVDLYRLYENVLNAVSHYLGDPAEVSITLPRDLDVKNADDISEELNTAKRNNLPYSVLTELTKKYLLTKFGNNDKNRAKADYLALKDRLFVYGIDDMAKATAILGRAITDRERTIHVMGWQILDKILKDLVEVPENLDALFEAELLTWLPEVGANVVI
jgi:hypothetical protein